MPVDPTAIAQQQLAQSMQTLTQQMQTMATSFQDVVRAQSQTKAAQEANRKRTEDINDELVLYRASLVKDRKLTEDQQKLVNQAIELKKRELKLIADVEAARQHEADVIRKNANDADAIGKAARARAAKEQALKDTKGQLKATTDTTVESFTKLSKGTQIANAALVWFGHTLSTAKDTVIAQNKANGGLVEGTGSLIGAMADQQTQALKHGMKVEDYAAITNASRQMFNAMGGTTAGLDQMAEAGNRFDIMTGSFTEGLKLTVETARAFAEKGIKPTAQAMALYQDDLVSLRRQTGLSVDQAAAMFQEVASDADSIELLRKARVGERESILASQRAMIQQSIAAGMSAEQAKEAAKMLNKMVAAKPLDRIRQAARVRAIGGAYGVDADSASRGILAGSRATDADKQAIAQFGTQIANFNDAAAQQGMASEIFTSTLTDKLDLDQYYGKSSAFSTTLGDTLKNATGDLSKNFIDASKTAEGSAARQLALLTEQTKLIANGNHWSGAILAGVTAIGAMMLQDKLGDLAGKLGSKLGSKLGFGKSASALEAAVPAAEGAEALGAAGNVASKVGWASKLGGVAKVGGKALGVGGAVLDAGLGVNDLMNGQNQKEMHGWDYLSPMRYGMWAGDKINQGTTAMLGGQSMGSKLYDWLHPDENLNKPTPLPIRSRAQTPQNAKDAKTVKDASDSLVDATSMTASSVTQQVKQLDQSNTLLQQIVDLQQRATDLAEKQLVASTLSDKEKNDATRSTLRKDNKFASTYSYA